MSSTKNNIHIFLQQQTCATICCVDNDGKPYCFNCFYAFNSADGLLYFKSSVDTHHLKLLKSNPEIAGTVLRDKLNKLAIKGIQLQGELLEKSHPMVKNASANYYKKYPLAMAIKGEIFTIQLSEIKMTDSRFGFGKKFFWRKQVTIGPAIRKNK